MLEDSDPGDPKGLLESIVVHAGRIAGGTPPGVYLDQKHQENRFRPRQRGRSQLGGHRRTIRSNEGDGTVATLTSLELSTKLLDDCGPIGFVEERSEGLVMDGATLVSHQGLRAGVRVNDSLTALDDKRGDRKRFQESGILGK